jgi:hypothetical protein
MWGPAPAITPSINKSTGKERETTSNSGPGSSAASTSSNSKDEESTAGKKGRKKKSKRLVDTSLLGFTVQPDLDRIEHLDD